LSVELNTKFGKLILGKIINTVATRYYILKLKCTEIDFGTPPDPLARFKGGQILKNVWK